MGGGTSGRVHSREMTTVSQGFLHCTVNQILGENVPRSQSELAVPISAGSGCGLSSSFPASNTSQRLPDQESHLSALFHSVYIVQQFYTIGILYQHEIGLLRNTWLNRRGLALAIQEVYRIHEGSHSKRHPTGKKS